MYRLKSWASRQLIHGDVSLSAAAITLIKPSRRGSINWGESCSSTLDSHIYIHSLSDGFSSHLFRRFWNSLVSVFYVLKQVSSYFNCLADCGNAVWLWSSRNGSWNFFWLSIITGGGGIMTESTFCMDSSFSKGDRVEFLTYRIKKQPNAPNSLIKTTESCIKLQSVDSQWHNPTSTVSHDKK